MVLENNKGSMSQVSCSDTGWRNIMYTDAQRSWWGGTGYVGGNELLHEN